MPARLQRRCPRTASGSRSTPQPGLPWIADRYGAQAALPWGTYHLSGTPVTTWHGLAESIFAEACAAGLLARAPLVHPIPTEAYPLPAPRPAHSALDCTLIRTHFGIEPTPWIAGLREVLNTWKRTP